MKNAGFLGHPLSRLVHRSFSEGGSEEQVVMVPGRGFEPRFCAPEAHVLPLDDPGVGKSLKSASYSSFAAHRLQRTYSYVSAVACSKTSYLIPF